MIALGFLVCLNKLHFLYLCKKDKKVLKLFQLDTHIGYVWQAKKRGRGILFPSLNGSLGWQQQGKKTLLFHVCLCDVHHFFHPSMEKRLSTLDPGAVESTTLNGSW